MKTAQLSDMKRGWFIGDFFPSVMKTDSVEVGIKEYTAGTVEEKHYHKIATEITVIYKGRARMFGKEWGEGSILVVEPGESTGFMAITDVVTVVAKIPGAKDDKYMGEMRDA